MSRTRPPVLIAHVLYRFGIGGLENGVVNLINGLPRDRFRHVLFCVEDADPEFARRLQREDVEIIALRRSRIGVWRMRWQLYRILRRLRPDIVHSRGLSGLDALLPARLAGCKTVHSEHGFEMSDLLGQSRKPALLRRLHAPLVQRYVCVSRDLGRLMSERWGIASRRILQIYNGVDTNRFTPAASKPLELLPEALQGPNVFVIGTVGRAQAVKDQASLLRAAALLVGQDGRWRERLAIAMIGDGPELDRLKALAEALGIADRCWFPGARSDVCALIQAFDLFALPSLNEGISNTLLEAMASGVPVVATRVGGNVELVNDGETGALFEPGDVPALARLIAAYASDEALRSRHGQRARARAVEQFSLATMMDAYRRVYESLCA